MEITLITPLSPDEVIPDRENDRLFMDMVERGDNGEFTCEMTLDDWLEMHTMVLSPD